MTKSPAAHIQYLAISLIALSTATPAAAESKALSRSDGRAMFKTAFNPERYFPFDYRGVRADGSMGTEELILAVRVAARDDYLPAHSMAIAYVCQPAAEKGTYECEYLARMLRFKDHEEGEYKAATSLTGSVMSAKGTAARRRAYEGGGLEWLDTKLIGCDGAIEAFDQLATKADWRPSLHYTRVKTEDREAILHPAQMWITMSGNDQITSWQGWRNANGAAYGVRNLISVLDACWKPSTAPKPWRRI